MTVQSSRSMLDLSLPRVRWATWVQDHRLATAFWSVCSFVVVLAASAIAGPDANWDLLNYHYNNGRALMTGSFRFDVGVAGLTSYLHPLIDAPVYLAIELTDDRWGLVVWLAVVQWLCYLAVWRLAGCLDGLRESAVRRLVAVVVVAFGSGAFSMAFTTFADWIAAAMLCEATRYVLLALDHRGTESTTTSTGRRVLLAGAWIGVALAVKLAAVTFAIGMFLGVAVALGLVAATRLVAGAIAGFLVVAGPWMLFLSVRYGNPLFPFYNGVFKSPSASTANFDDTRFGSNDFLDLPRFPIRMLRGGSSYSELPLRDWRYVALLGIVVVLAIVLDRVRFMRVVGERRVAFVITTLVVGFATWIVAFGIYRYFLFGEVLVSLLLAAIVGRLVVDEWRLVVSASLLLPIGIAFQDFPPWGRGDVFANTQLDALVESGVRSPARVLFVGPPPLSYLTESFPASSHFAALTGFDTGDLRLEGGLADEFRAFIDDGLGRGTLYVISDAGVVALPDPVADLTLSNCAPFESLKRPLQLCAVTGSGA